MHKDYYKILGISTEASDAEIKKAFRAKAKEYHPEFNTSSDADNNFVLLNEAYEILIHHKTREINSGSAPEHFPAYQHWLQVARERSAIHSRLPYSEFVRTKFYRSTRTSPYMLYLIDLLVGIVIILLPLVLLFVSTNEVVSVVLLFLSLPLGIFLIVVGLGGLATMKKYKKERRREMKKTQKLA